MSLSADEWAGYAVGATGAVGGWHPLDAPVWSSLTGVHAGLAEGSGPALRYQPDIAPFGAVAPDRDGGWPALAALAGTGPVLLAGLNHPLPSSWEVVGRIPGVQLVATDALVTAPEPDAVPLGMDDVDEMLDLVARTEPGPFLRRTVLLGTYLGVRRGGALVAMAGERLRPAGWTEISAVCTDPAHRGQGLAGRLVRAVGHGIRARGETPFLHTSAGNRGAIRLYGSLGFQLRRPVEFNAVRPPAPDGGAR
jgi:ribosomal protein S18 acetylase RimI-like enzyme